MYYIWYKEEQLVCFYSLNYNFLETIVRSAFQTSPQFTFYQFIILLTGIRYV